MDPAAVRRLAAALPEVEDASDDRRLVFAIKGKGFAWSFMERAPPKKPRAPRLDILAVRCPMDSKEMLIAAGRIASSTTTTTTAIRPCSCAWRRSPRTSWPGC